ncbi:hypothetical protein [Pectinatus brassicae]|uniref:Uncharacterized protein n=1 Tax=Pectinatus brassicae TaxID=862415 RepID=A0A840ULW9_9FIRM|nr:hypothetical protein [Pectinatus brassicae]MBB5337190.1 hypothetical protein [Pectinatus brassicae]
MVKIFLSAKCRQNIEKIIPPLNTERIDSFELRNPNEPENKLPIEQINKDDIDNFILLPIETINEEEIEESEMTVKIISINFEKGKW